VQNIEDARAEARKGGGSPALAGWLAEKYNYWRSCWYKSTNTDTAMLCPDVVEEEEESCSSRQRTAAADQYSACIFAQPVSICTFIPAATPVFVLLY